MAHHNKAMTIHGSVLETIRSHAYRQAQHLDTAASCSKLESPPPGGSIRDRIGLSMIESAEQAGRIKAWRHTLVEGTAGIPASASPCRPAKGYKLIPRRAGQDECEKIFNLKAMGAEVVLTRSDVAKDHPQYYQDLAIASPSRRPALFHQRFSNPGDNPARPRGGAPAPGNPRADGWQARRHRVRLRLLRAP